MKNLVNKNIYGIYSYFILVLGFISVFSFYTFVRYLFAQNTFIRIHLVTNFLFCF